MALALGLRLWGIEYGLPHPLARPDEERITDKALRMLSDRTLGPGEFIYPSLQKYLAAGALEIHYGLTRFQGRTTSVAEFVELVTVIHPRLYYRTCRLVSVVTGVATVPLVFLLACRLSGRRGDGLIAALLLAVCYLHVRESHYATVDVTMTFFTTLCVLLAVHAARAGRARDFAWSGLAAGLAAATKYNAGIVGLSALVAAGVAAHRQEGSRAALAVRWSLAAMAAGAAGFLIGVPFAVREHQRMIAAVSGVSAALRSASGPTGFELHLLHSLPGGLGWPLFLASVAAAARAAWSRRPEEWVWLSFAAAFFVVIGPIRWVVPRYVLPLVPLLIVAAATLVGDLASRSRVAAAATLALLAFPTGWSAVQYDRLASRPDTRVLAADWIAERLPPRARIAVCEGYGAPVLHGLRPGRMPFLPRVSNCSRADIADARPDYVLSHEHPVLGWSAPAGHLRDVLGESWRPAAVFDPFADAGGGAAYYFTGDAFYMPYTGLGTVTHGGPIVTVWEKSDPALR
jgi:hypothetical protein